MPELPQFKEENPVLGATKASSKAQGYENFAKALGSLAEKAGSEAKTLATEESNTMYVNSVANIQQAKGQAQIRMLENPQEAAKIAEQTNTILGDIGQNSSVNKNDRAKLNYHVQTAQQAVNLEGVKSTVKQSQLGAAFTHYSNLPDQIHAYAEAMITDPDKTGKEMHDKMLSSLEGLVRTGVISPQAAANQIKLMGQAVNLADQMHREYQSGDTTPRQYHTLAANPLNPNAGVPNPNAPIESNTAWAVHYHNSDRTYQGVLSDINNRNKPDPSVFMSLNSNQREHAILSTQGMQVADGIINSGTAFPTIEKTYQVLSNKGGVLGYREASVRQGLAQYITDLKNGNYLTVMGRDPQGMNIMEDFTTRDAAINSSLANDPVKRHEALLANKDAQVNAAVAWGQGRHIPNEYIQPISQADVANVENAFVAGHNPMDALTILGSYSKQNQVYVANAMKNPTQRIMMQAMAFAPPTMKPEDRLDFIAANQTGRTDLSKHFEDQKIESKFYAEILTSLTPQLQFIQQNYDPEQAQMLKNSMVESTAKYGKYLAEKNGNPGLKNVEWLTMTPAYSQYAHKAASIYQNSFQAESGTNYSVNKNQLSIPMTRNQMDALAAYAIKHGENYLAQGRSQGEIQRRTSESPLRMIVSPTNQVMAVDSSGGVAFTAPLTTDIIAHAEKELYAEKSKVLRGNMFGMENVSPMHLPNMIGKALSVVGNSIVPPAYGKGKKKVKDSNDIAVDLIKGVEGFSENAYQKKGDKPTIGYGETKGVKMGDTITEPEARARLKERVKKDFATEVDKKIKVPLTKSQRAALTSFSYVAGGPTKKMADHINAGDFSKFREDALEHYDNVIKKHPEKERFRQGWENRTNSEEKVFNKKPTKKKGKK